jgi:hypothetical protein
MTQPIFESDIFVVDDFFNHQLIADVWHECQRFKSVDVVDLHGLFKEILPTQTVGQLVGFKRDLWHSSDSFHLKGVVAKHFLQILVDTV